MNWKESLKSLGKFERKSVIVIALSMFILGFGGGFFLYGLYQQKIEVLVPAAIILAILTWFGSATDILGLLRDWYREQKDQERKESERLASLPNLSIVYDERDADQYCPSIYDYRIGGIRYSRKYLRIRVKNDGGIANDCEAILKVNIKSGSYPTTEEKYLQWTKHIDTKIDIPVKKMLF